MSLRRRLMVPLLVLIVAGIDASASVGAGTHDGLGNRLVNRLFLDLKRHDVADLRGFLSPTFQSQRTDGTRETKAEYLNNLPNVLSYKLIGFRTTASQNTVVVTYRARTDEVINGKEYKNSYSPRMTVFALAGGGWKIIAHGNFNSPA